MARGILDYCLYVEQSGPFSDLFFLDEAIV
jgi:hypothetical protein